MKPSAFLEGEWFDEPWKEVKSENVEGTRMMKRMETTK